MQPEPTTLAYLAGVIDSDGYISAQIGKQTGTVYVAPVVGIAGTNRAPHDLAASLFGGNVGTYLPHGERAGNRLQYQWQRYGRKSVPVIEAILPYLRVKADQAHLALWLNEMLEEARGERRSDDPYPWFGPYYEPGRDLLMAAQEIRDLNLRGYRAHRTWDEYPHAEVPVNA